MTDDTLFELDTLFFPFIPHGVLRPTGELLFRFPMAQIPKRLFGFPVAFEKVVRDGVGPRMLVSTN